MLILKKLIFAPIFLIFFASLIYQLNPFLKSYDIVFSLSVNTLIQLLTLAATLSLSCFLYALLVTLTQDWRLVMPVILLSAALPFVFLDPALAVVSAVAIIISFLLIFLSLDTALKSYLNFQPFSVLGPSIRHLAGLLILSFCLVYFLSTSKLITQKGFEVPDSLIDAALKMAPTNTLQQAPNQQLPTINQDQLDFLKQNPNLLKQAGLDPKMLDTLNNPSEPVQTPTQISNDLIKQTIQNQVQDFIKPYLQFIPAVLAILLFLTLQSLTAVTGLITYPLIWLTFLVLGKIGFTKFEIEMRQVKKLVV